MKYLGGKQKIANQLLDIMLPFRRSGQTWVEPFVGGANVICKVTNPRIGSDNNPYLIAYYRAIVKGWNPPEIVTEKLYRDIQVNKEKYPPELVAYVGFYLSFGAKWFACFAPKYSKIRDYPAEALSEHNYLKHALQGIIWFNNDYRQLEIPPNSLIYCDPPYFQTTKYHSTFYSPAFWLWAKRKKEEGHTVFVSESNAPDDIQKIWSKSINISCGKNITGKRQTENLYLL